MKRTRPLLLALFIVVTLLATSAFAQIGSGPAAVTNSPYSIVQETEHIQTLADGTHITNKTQQHLYRDSYGSTRIETAYPPESGMTGVVDIRIFDAISDKRYFLDVRSRIAQLVAPLRKLPPNPNAPTPPPLPPPPEDARPKITNEDLGTQTIEGLIATGTRTTITVPLGAQGNDRPLVTVREVWFSPDLRMVLYTKTSDPRNGETITRIVSIDRSEPDPTLFQVPPDYVIREPNQQ